MPYPSQHEYDAAALGDLLRRAREGRGLTLEQVSSETKIPYRHLKAIEHNNMAAVPGEFYRRAEIRTYAQAVGLDQKIALAALEGAVTTPLARVATKERQKAQDLKLSYNRVLIAISVVVAAAVLGRAMSERAPAPGSDSQIRRRPPLSRAALPQTPSMSPAAVAIEAPAASASPDSNGIPVETTDQNDPRESADTVTELVVTTQPPDARVTVNGIGWGASPVTIRYLPAGEKRIRVTKAGYATEERIVRLTDGRPTTVDIQLHTP